MEGAPPSRGRDRLTRGAEADPLLRATTGARRVRTVAAMTKITRIAIAAAAAGGALWTVKAAIITVRDAGFDPLEGVFFIGGLLAVVAAALLVPLALSQGRRPLARGAAVIAGVPLLVAATLAVEALGKTLAEELYAGGNLGIAQESGILLCGLAWLAGAILLGSRRVRPRAAA